jgi:hypothetical protein
VAKSSTSFKPNNRAAVKPGNKLAVRHGAESPELIALRLPAIRDRVRAELGEVPYLIAPDSSLVERYCSLIAQAEMREEWFQLTGGMFTVTGAPRPGFSSYMLLLGNVEKFARVLGLGAHPRAQVAQAMAGAGKDVAMIRAAQERARARLLNA